MIKITVDLPGGGVAHLDYDGINVTVPDNVLQYANELENALQDMISIIKVQRGRHLARIKP